MTWRISPIIIFLALFAIVVVCYAPTLSASYGFSDDYALLMGAIHGPTSYHVATAGGRPTYALLLRLSFAPLHSISELRYVRLFGVFCTTVLMFSLYRILVRYGWEALPSFFFVVIIGTLPSFQVYAAWATVSLYPCAMLVSASALWCVERACVEGKRGRQWWWVTGAVCLMTLALTIHQSSAMFFWVFVAISVLSSPVIGKDLLRRVWWCSGVMVASLILGFVIFRIGIWLYGIGPVGVQRASLVTNLWEKIYWFLREPLTNALNGINLFPSWNLAIGMALWTMGGLALTLRGNLKEKITKSIYLLVLIPLSYLPNLLVAENWASYRTLSALTSLIMLYVFVALSGYEQFLRRFVAVRFCAVVLGVAALFSVALAARQVSRYFVVPQHRELAFVRSRLAQADWSSVHGVYFLGVNDFSASLGSRLPVRYDEFGFSSLVPVWSLRALVPLLLQTLAPEHRDVPITLISSSEQSAPSPHALIIDLREFSSFVVNERE